MKKLFILVAFAFIVSGAIAQTSERSVTQEKITKSEELTFKNQEDKDARIESLEKLIKHRLSQGKTKSEMKKYYEELEEIKKAVVLNKEEEK